MKLISLLALFLSFPAWSLSDCGFNLAVTNPVIQLTDTSQVIQLTTRVNRETYSSNSNCVNYRIFFGRGLANSYTRRAFTLFNFVNYNLHRNINQSGVLKEFGDAATANEWLDGSAPNRNTAYNERFYLSVPGLTGNTIPRGYYYDNVQVSIYSIRNNGRLEYDDTTTMTVLLYIASQIDVSLVDEGGTFDASATSKIVDFGILTKNQTKGVDLRVVSNTSYRVRLSSTNGSKLKNSVGNGTVAYSLKVNNTTVNLTPGNTLEIGSGNNTGNEGDKFNLKFQITDDPTNLPAGNYQDNITVTAVAN